MSHFDGLNTRPMSLLTLRSFPPGQRLWSRPWIKCLYLIHSLKELTELLHKSLAHLVNLPVENLLWTRSSVHRTLKLIRRIKMRARNGRVLECFSRGVWDTISWNSFACISEVQLHCYMVPDDICDRKCLVAWTAASAPHRTPYADT